MRVFTGVLVGIGLAAASLPADATAQYDLDGTVSAYPAPGTISASNSTQISFRGRARPGIGTVSVRGSRTGRHAGTLRSHSDGKGASWVPKRRFTGGERVTVRTSLPIAGAKAGDFTLRIGRIPVRVTLQERLLENIAPGKVRSFRSRPDLKPPLVTVSPNPGPTAPGLVFLSPKAKNDTKQAGPMIIDNEGRLIWFQARPGVQAATEFRAQTYRGKPVLTYWDGTSRQGIGVGDLVILDQAYREIRRFTAPNGFRPDLHEFLITADDTAVLISYPSVRTDLRRIGGARNQLTVDSVIQEIDIATGLIVFEWHSLGHIGLAETFSAPIRNPEVPFDYAHFNSVNLDRDGDFIASARNTWAVYKIDRETSAIRWRLGGRQSSFKLGAGVKFAWQHDAQRREPDGAITLFDNSAFPPVRKHTRVLAITLDERRRTARLKSAYLHPRKLLVATQGNVQNLPDGGSFVGWGSQRYFTEYDARGRVRWDARLSVGFESYRAYRLPWVGRPVTRPKIVVDGRGRRAMDVFVSWNGATEVASWEVMGGPSPSPLTSLKLGPRAGFETRIPVAARTRWVAVRALDAAGNVLGTSPVARVASGG